MSNPDAPVEVGQILAGKYRIDRVLGAGGMGVVVAATHVHLDQRVAIKFLLPAALANADVVARFQREARAAVKIQSEHVARVIDVGTLESGAPYMVMEYLEGVDLSQRIAEERTLPVADVVRFVLEACEALAEAHAAGIVHRDLKPANLFLARRADKTSMVKVLDFGISKSNVAGSGGITSTQAVMGSPYYMSPEQLMSAKHVDHRADIWSLGIVLYEALVGTPPYVGDTMPEIVAQILQAGAPSVRAKRPDVPAELDAIVARCLSKDASTRYRDVAELATALVPFSADGARSMERISRVLGSSVRPPSPSISGAEPAVTSDARGGTVAMPRAASISNPAQSAWGATQAGIPRKSNAWMFIAGGVGVVAIGAIGVVAWSSSSKPKDAAPASGVVVSVEATSSASLPSIPVPPSATIAIATATASAALPPTIDTTPVHVAGIKPTKPSASVAATKPTVTASAQPAVTAQPTQTAQSSLHMGIK